MNKRPHKEYDRIKEERWFACAVFGYCLMYFVAYVIIVMSASALFNLIQDFLVSYGG